MELYKEILAHALNQGEIKVIFPCQEPDLSKIIEGRCYQALKRIKTILEDDLLDGKECFQRIEEIVCAFEEIGSTCGSRHDFG